MKDTSTKMKGNGRVYLIQLAICLSLLKVVTSTNHNNNRRDETRSSIPREFSYTESSNFAGHDDNRMTYPVSSRLNFSTEEVTSRNDSPGDSSTSIPSSKTLKPPTSNSQQRPAQPERSHFDPLSFFSNQDIDGDFDPTFFPPDFGNQVPLTPEPELPAYAVDDSDDALQGDPNEERNNLPHSPVIYRYYGKSRSRTRASGSIPFILLGPNVEHWKRTGEHLAARGFSVIACEREPLEPEEGDDNQKTKNKRFEQQSYPPDWVAEDWWKSNDNEGANLVLNVLKASRWSKAILVACDAEAVIAIQAAMKLAPDKIAGVVLCGDLKELDALLLRSRPYLNEEGHFAIDVFLRHLLPCPFAIAWDGEGVDYGAPVAAALGYDASSPAECLNGNRCFILGGGIAPHRKQPETFSWTLTRFVEDKVAPSIPMSEKKKIFTRVKKERSDSDRVPLPRIDGFFHKFLCGDYFSTGSFVVYGRVIASAILYATILKVCIYQYGNFLDGMVNMKSRYDMIKMLPRKILKAISGFFLNYGYISRLFRRRRTDPSDLTGPETDLLEQDRLDQNKLETRQEDSEDHDQEASHDDEGEETADGQTEENSESEEKKADDDTEVSPQEPEEERRRFEPPPFFLLDRVIASVDPTGVGSDISRNYKT